ncbi:MAG: hypothetical protein ACT6SF_02685 [Hydrogenophaga sp.]|jgi:hypothetical protein|uniref:hypothetical protein n=1 Tax=Hydrogenophaga sp. TaxID=1904254 RepID=UPI001D1E600F|nr:hypothetical protein [Hydrogenophaga sp.]MBW0170800.1 hypothetical protein [Hydrogenophaga sp.]MBW0183498.1 hypothetical protein [Hydrogenophaga sp.]
MDLLILLLAAFAGVAFVNAQEQKRRIALLGHHLGQYQIEALMENITQGYLRALGEDDAERREQIWSLLAGAERSVAEQFGRFANGFSQVDAAASRVSKLALALPGASRLLPGATFDVREAFRLHAAGIASAVANEAQHSLRDKAFTLSAELFLMQHTCHWFCRSRAVASARLLRRHQTSHEQVLAAVSPATRHAYRELTGI